MRLFGFLVLTFSLSLLSGQTMSLYLRDGSELIVSDYKVLTDRVQYYSVHRGSWEEIPLQYVDLDRTQQEYREKQATKNAREREDRIERAGRRKIQTELHRVPIEDGVYHLQHDGIAFIAQADVITVANKLSKLLQIVAPIFLDKSTLEIHKAESLLETINTRPLFYVRLQKIQRLMIVRLTQTNEKKYIVQQLVQAPENADIFEKQKEVEVFRQQLAPTVYKIWPVEPLTPGNYAVIEFTRGKGNARVWGFTVKLNVDRSQ
jgi:hypothetical protein